MSTTEMIAESLKVANKVLDIRIKRMSKTEVKHVLRGLQKQEVCSVIDSVWGIGASQCLMDRMRDKATGT